MAGEVVEADEGTGFLLTGSVLGTETLGRDAGVGGGGLEEEESRREGRPRSIIVLHFSGSGSPVHGGLQIQQ